MTGLLNIVAFVCENHPMDALTAASMAGQSPPESIRFVKVPCAGRVELVQLIEALRNGADGVIVMACLEENCYHSVGSMLARGRAERCRELLKEIGIEPERVELINAASVSGAILLRMLRAFEAKMADLPVSPFKGAKR